MRAPLKCPHPSPRIVPNKLEQPQGHTAIDSSTVTGEKGLLSRSRCCRFPSNHLTGCGIFLIRDVVHLHIQLGESEPGVFHLNNLMNINIRDHIGGDTERIAVVQEVAIVITTFDPATPSSRRMIIL